jgi:YihY family inner membrane protein
MNPAERVLRSIDRAQQSFAPTAFIFGVVKKHGDDNGGVLVANVTYAAFISLFPLLLVLVTVLGLVAANDPGFRQAAINAVANQVPLIGHELTANVHQLRRSSVIGLIAGLLGLIWGSTGLAQAGLFTMEQVWNLPGPARPGFFPRLLRALMFLGLLAILVITSTLLASLSSYRHWPLPLIVVIEVLVAVVNAAMFLGGFRILTPKGVSVRELVPGAVTAGILWTVLQVVGAFLVHHYLHSDSVYGMFATVLGLVAWLYLAAEITVYCAEVNVVLSRRLWPRSIAAPPLTEADRASMTLQALQNQRREEQVVTVRWRDDPDARDPDSGTPSSTPRSPGQVLPPPRKPSGDEHAVD